MSIIDRFPMIWCSNCQKAEPLMVIEMFPDDMNKTGAADLMCSECLLIIATLHEKD